LTGINLVNLTKLSLTENQEKKWYFYYPSNTWEKITEIERKKDKFFCLHQIYCVSFDGQVSDSTHNLLLFNEALSPFYFDVQKLC